MTSETPNQSDEEHDEAAVGVWTIGYIEDSAEGINLTGNRTISDETYAEYEAAVKFVLERQAQTALKLAIGNYNEFRALQSSMAIAFTTTRQANWPNSSESQFHLRRILLNLLNSIRLFDDHNRTRIVRIYGDPSVELDAYLAARSSIYDQFYSYRFMFELRNFAQHCGEVPVHAEVHLDMTASTLNLYFDRDELLSEFDNWKQVKRDLKTGPARFGIDTPIEETMVAVTRLAQEVVNIDLPKFKESIDRIQEILGSEPQHPDQRPTIFRTRIETDEAGLEVMKMDLATVLDVRLGHSHDQATNLDVPDFSSHRPTMSTDKAVRRCQGPLNKVTRMPSESCSENATTSFYFPHQEGLAFLFACEGHALSLGQWAGKRFGGCFGGDVDKTDIAMQMAAKSFSRIDTPHSAEYGSLIPIPGAPQVQSFFNSPIPTEDTQGATASE